MKYVIAIMVLMGVAVETQANLRITATRAVAAVKDRCEHFRETAMKLKPNKNLAAVRNIKETIKLFGLPDRVSISRKHPGMIAMIYERKASWDEFSLDPIPAQVSNSDICGVLLAQGSVRDVEWK